MSEEKEYSPDQDAASVAAMSDEDLASATEAGKVIEQVKTVQAVIDPYSTSCHITCGDAGTPEKIGGPGSLFIRGNSNAGEFNSTPAFVLCSKEEVALLQKVMKRVTSLCAKKGR